MTFGEKLKAARIESGLKQSELAKKLNTTGNTISNWENNV
ncbi:MAG: helix-turn-helix transcriptional regulator, partial [Ruminococcus sp.]|nr:helix-turn-helix transcriptional regulator [Dorea sp.]MCI9604855.1 helix-turn-helix transcriptional regulator [Ruminococcus sp.]